MLPNSVSAVRRATRPAALVLFVTAVCAVVVAAASAESGSSSPGPSAASHLAAQLLNGVGDARSDAVAGVLASFGINDQEGTEAQLQAINVQLQRLADQTAQFQSAVTALNIAAASPGSRIVAEKAHTWRNRINSLEAELRDASGAPTAAARKKLAQAAFDRIAAINQDFNVFVELVDAGNVSADSVVRAAFVSETADRFLTHAESVRIRYFLDAYAFYAAKLGWLIVNYRVASGLYSQAQLRTFATAVAARVAKIESLRRSAVPEHTVVDVRTGLQWSSGRYGTATNPAGDPRGFLTLIGIAGQTKESGWSVPTDVQLKSLVHGWVGSPSEWLVSNGGFLPMTHRNPVFCTQTVTSRAPAGTGQKGPVYRTSGETAAQSSVTSGASGEPWYFVVNMRTGAELSLPSTGPGFGFIPVRTPPEGAFLPPGFKP